METTRRGFIGALPLPLLGLVRDYRVPLTFGQALERVNAEGGSYIVQVHVRYPKTRYWTIVPMVIS